MTEWKNKSKKNGNVVNIRKNLKISAIFGHFEKNRPRLIVLPADEHNLLVRIRDLHVSVRM